MARWQPAPIVGGAYSDDSKPWSAQDCVNFIVTPAERGGTHSPGKLTCLPGYTTFCATMQEAPVRGLHDVEGLLLAVTGDTLYRIGTDGAATSIGTIPGVGRVSMAHNQVTYGHEVMIANGQSGYVYNTYTGAFGQVTDDGFSGFTVCDFVDGYIAGTDPQGRFWAHGMLRQAGEFNTLDQYDSEAAPDKVLSLIVSHREVMILNQRTASFSINTGAATGTFQNSNGTEMDVGIASPWARARLDNTVYWLGHDGVVYRLEGHNPIRKSTGPIEQAISRCDMSKAFAFTFEDRGHKVFYLTFPDGQTWGYDVWTNEWHRRQSKDLNRWRIDALVKWNGVWIAGDFSNGKLYQLDWAVQSEAGEEMERRRISAVLHDNGNRVTVNAVKIEVDTGLGADSFPRPVPALPPLTISGALPDGNAGEVASYQYTASGGVLQHGAFEIASGALPTGLSMDEDGVVSGTHSEGGTYTWTVQITDAAGQVATLEDSAIVRYRVWAYSEINEATDGFIVTTDPSTMAGTLIPHPTGVELGIASETVCKNDAPAVPEISADGGMTFTPQAAVTRGNGLQNKAVKMGGDWFYRGSGVICRLNGPDYTTSTTVLTATIDSPVVAVGSRLVAVSRKPGDGFTVRTSDDAGDTWNSADFAAGQLTNAPYGMATDGTNLVLVVARSVSQPHDVWESADAGDSWTKVGTITQDPTYTNSGNAMLRYADGVWLFGKNRFIARSTDRSTWAVVWNNPDNNVLTDLAMVGSGAVATQGSALYLPVYTNDGGLTWDYVTPRALNGANYVDAFLADTEYWA